MIPQFAPEGFTRCVALSHSGTKHPFASNHLYAANFLLSGLFCVLLLFSGTADAVMGSNSQIGTGDAHSCVLTTGGGVQCWGLNNEGQLGDGTFSDRSLPVNVLGLSKGIVQIAVGGVHTCALTNEGGVKCWGANGSGQLGDLSFDPSPVPVDVWGLETGVLSITAGYLHTCALTTSGSARCWGYNSTGQLGNGLTDNSFQQVQVSGLNSGVKAISAGEFHTCALTLAGDAQCWGSGENGQLGNDVSGEGTFNATPQPVLNLGSGVLSISAGGYHSCAIDSAGAAKCWGSNFNGQLGDVNVTQSQTPVNVSGLSSGTVVISAGLSHSCAVMSDGAAKCWGVNLNGELGNDDLPNDSNVPVDVSTLNSNVADISANDDHSCALTRGGQVLCWGSNVAGQLGDNSNDQKSTPANVMGLSGLTVVAAGNRHACAINTNGAVQCWGDNEFSQLGNGGTDDSPNPVLVADYHSGVRSVDVGENSGCLITGQGAALCWGNNVSGQLGNGTFDDAPAPVPVTGLDTGVSSISVGRNHACAVHSGAAKCWGLGNQGVLGNGSSSTSNVPVAVTGLASGVLSVSVGSQHSCALLNDGGVRCWGDNAPGQLGDGTNTDSDEPVTPTGINNAIALSSGGDHTCVVLSDNTARCWGKGISGQLGQNVFSGSASPVVVSNLNAAVDIELGNTHSCAILIDQTAKCWGANGSGRLGNGVDSGNYAAPVDVLELNDIQNLSAGGEFTCATIANGEVRCWGNNSSGQLGRAGTFSSTAVLAHGFNGLDAVIAGNKHTCLFANSGQMKCWGDNAEGQLGNGNFDDLHFPTTVAGLGTVTAAAAGSNHSCALADDFSVRCWGNNSFGQLGVVAGSPSATPVLVPGFSAVSITAGMGFNCAVTSNTSVQCWGFNSVGQLGNNSTQNSHTPVTVTFTGAPLSGVANLVSGYNHSCAVKNSVVYCWGSNQYGQLGVGDETDRQVGTAVAGVSGVAALSAGGYHTCALINDGTMKCWGRNFGGQLGTGDADDYNTPQVVNISNVSAIATGSDHTCAIKPGGELVCWGWNGNGQLGDRTTIPRHNPAEVAGLGQGVVAVDAGEEHTCAITDTGILKCWGWNDNGQLGDGSTDNRSKWTNVFPLEQHIGFTPPATASSTDPIFLGAMATSGLEPGFDSWTPSVCLQSGTTVTPFTTGFCGVRASQIGDINYAAAPQQRRLIYIFIEILFRDGFETIP